MFWRRKLLLRVKNIEYEITGVSVTVTLILYKYRNYMFAIPVKNNYNFQTKAKVFHTS